MNFRIIVVLNGSISASFSAMDSECSETPNNTRKIRYLIDHSRSCKPQGTVSCGSLTHFANLIENVYMINMLIVLVLCVSVKIEYVENYFLAMAVIL